MSLTERAAEGVARRVDRRRFLNRAAAAVFGFAATAAVEGIFAPMARADGPCPNAGETCGCRPPGGVYCSSSQCAGSTCRSSAGCTGWLRGVNGGVYANGCWCSKRCCYNCSQQRNYCGYYVCCDCVCNGSNYCGCRSFFTTCDNIDGGPPCC